MDIVQAFCFLLSTVTLLEMVCYHQQLNRFTFGSTSIITEVTYMETLLVQALLLCGHFVLLLRNIIFLRIDSDF